MNPFDLVIKNGTCLTPWGRVATDVAVRHGRIAGFCGGEARQVIDATGLMVLPGLIDPHVHLRDPGSGDASAAAVENIPLGTKAAVLGGLACVFDMPNTNPPATDAAALAKKRDYAGRNSWCDIGLYVGATKSNIPTLGALEAEPGVCAIKVFAGSSTGDLLIEDDESLERVMRSGRRRVAYHSEDEYRLRERRALFQPGQPYAMHAEWRDVECAFLGTRRLMALAMRTRRPTHILHVSTAEELAYLHDYREVATVEVLVNHLTQVAPDAYARLGAYAVMNPPIRDRRHWEAAWAAVADGMVDCIGSDHAPHSREAKAKPWPATAAGLTGVQTIVPVMLDHVATGRLSLERLVDLMCAGPARVYGAIGKGRLAAGYDGDFTLVDMNAERVIEESAIVSPCGWTPFAGMRVRGWPVATVVRGNVVMRDGEVLGAPLGKVVSFT